MYIICHPWVPSETAQIRPFVSSNEEMQPLKKFILSQPILTPTSRYEAIRTSPSSNLLAIGGHAGSENVPSDQPVIWKFETYILWKGIARPQSQFPHSCVCERFIHIPRIGPPILLQEYMDRSCEYINRSQTHEFGYWDWGSAIPYLAIHKWDCRCSVSMFVTED